MTGTTIHHAVPPRDMPVEAVFDFVASTTPNDQGLLLEAILAGRDDAGAAARLGVTPKLCAMAIEIMTWQAFREGIPGLLPTGTVVANKTGTGKNGKMDAGIVFRDGEPFYVISAYTDRVPAAMPDGLPGLAIASATIARLSRACWEMLA
jgi:beta-lactamase class A